MKFLYKVPLVVFFLFVFQLALKGKALACTPSADGICGEVSAVERADGLHDFTYRIDVDQSFNPNDIRQLYLKWRDNTNYFCRLPFASTQTGIDLHYECDFRITGTGSRVIQLRWVRTLRADIVLAETNINVSNAADVPGYPWFSSATRTPAGYEFVIDGKNGRSYTIEKGRVRVDGFEGGAHPDDWPPEYSCSGSHGGFRVAFISDWNGPYTIECDFSSLPLAVYTLELSFGGLAEVKDTISFSLLPALIEAGPNRLNDFVFANKFGFVVGIYAGAPSGVYTLSVIRPGTSDKLGTPCSTPAVSGIRSYDVPSCNFSDIAPGNYKVALFGPNGTKYDEKDILIIFDATRLGYCTCRLVGAPMCPTDLEVDGNLCVPGSTPDLSCSGVGATTCDCACVDDGTFTLPPLTKGLEDLQRWFGNLHKYLIAIGVVASVFIIPYIGVLFATGNVENIKKAAEWLKNLIMGLLLLLLSGTIIRVVGSEVLGL